MPAARKKTRKKTGAGKKVRVAKKAAARKKPAAPETPTAASRAQVALEAAPPEASLEARLMAPLREMERMLDVFRRREWFRPMLFEWPRWPEMPPEARFPSLDVIDRDKEIQIRAEIPGIDKEDLSVTVTDRALSIKGESRHEEQSEEGELHRREIRSGSFSRTVTLPEEVDGQKAVASYKDGVLEIRLPKRRRSKKHDIKVS